MGKDVPPPSCNGTTAAISAAAPEGDRPASWIFAPNVRAHPETTGNHYWPDAAALLEGTVGVAWMDDHLPGGYHIFYSASTDGGQNWSTPEKIDTRTTGAYSKFVSLAFTPAGIAVAVWEDDRGGTYNVYFSKRDPANPGGPWTDEVRVNTDGSPPGGSDFMNPSITVLDEDRYFVAWTDWREGVFHQVYARGTRDGGLTWTAEARVSDEIGYEPVAGDPCLVVDPTSGTVPGTEILYCLTNDWRGYAPGGRFPDVVFYRSTDGGATWSVGVRVNDITEAFQQDSSHSLVCLVDGTLTAGWLNNNWVLSTFRTSVSSDQGAHWSASSRVDDPAMSGTGTYSSIAGAGIEVFAGFDSPQADWNCYFRSSSDGGRTWLDPVVRMDDDDTGAASTNAVLATAGADEVFGTWQDTRSGPGASLIYTALGTRDVTGLDGWAPSGFTAGREGVRCAPNPSHVPDPVRLRLTDRASSDRSGISVSDAAGRSITRLPILGLEMIWDGRDVEGRPLPSGTYWVRVEGPSGGRATRVVRVR
jgi:hypothetical protein